MSNTCPCCSGISYQNCCEPYHNGIAKPSNPEALMRSRYAAYSLQLIDYLWQTTHPSVRKLYDKKSIAQWAKENRWLKLEILNTTANKVRFKAHYQNNNQYYIHHEDSTFEQEDGNWYYVKGIFPEEN